MLTQTLKAFKTQNEVTNIFESKTEKTIKCKNLGITMYTKEKKFTIKRNIMVDFANATEKLNDVLMKLYAEVKR